MLGGKEKKWKVLHVCNTLSPSRYMAGSDYCGRVVVRQDKGLNGSPLL